MGQEQKQEQLESNEQIRRLLVEAEESLRTASQGSPEWRSAFTVVGLARTALRADRIGDICVIPDPRYHKNAEFNHPDNLAVYVKGKKFPYLIDEPDIAMLFGLAFKYLEINDAPRFVAFAARMLGIKSEYGVLRTSAFVSEHEPAAALTGDNR
jgi:hypothetical protein